MFRVTINEKYTKLKGKDGDLLKGLIFYIRALKELRIPDKIIIQSFEYALGNEITEKLEIKRVDLSSLTEKEVKDVFQDIVSDLLNNRRKRR